MDVAKSEAEIPTKRFKKRKGTLIALALHRLLDAT
jgi:hypothetical protein